MTYYDKARPVIRKYTTDALAIGKLVDKGHKTSAEAAEMMSELGHNYIEDMTKIFPNYWIKCECNKCKEEVWTKKKQTP